MYHRLQCSAFFFFFYLRRAIFSNLACALILSINDLTIFIQYFAYKTCAGCVNMNVLEHRTSVSWPLGPPPGVWSTDYRSLLQLLQPRLHLIMFNKALTQYNFAIIYNHSACSGIKTVSDKQVGIFAGDMLVLSCHLMLEEQITAKWHITKWPQCEKQHCQRAYGGSNLQWMDLCNPAVTSKSPGLKSLN